jgi:PKD repeat protein
VWLANGHFQVLASHTYAEEGTYTLSVQVQDDGGASIFGSQTISVADAALRNLGLTVLRPTEDFALGAGAVTIATFLDNNAAAPAADFTATVTWGDGSTTTLSGASGGIVALGAGKFAVQASHTYAEEGSYTLSVQILDVGGSTTAAGRGITVADAALSHLSVKNPSAKAGHDTGTFTVATFSDANLSAPVTDFTATVTWGDGSTSTLSSADFVSLGGGNFAVLSDHTYTAAGTYTLALLVDDVGGYSITGQLKISVT